MATNNILRFRAGTSGRTDVDDRGPSVSVHDSSNLASRAVADQIADLIRSKAALGQIAVLGLATGSTPQNVYDILVHMHREEGLSFRNVIAFNLDEYWPMPPHALQSYRRFMAEHLFDHVDIDPANIHIPDGTLPQDAIPAFCQAYEDEIRKVGGIDLQLLGIGRTGHIGFNEPGSPRHSRTRLMMLDRITRRDAASDFFGEQNVPRRGITVGVGTILDAKKIILLAFGESKAAVIRQAFEGEVTVTVAASFLQQHPNVDVILDRAAAAELLPVKTPWLHPPTARQGLTWDAALTRRAVIWLARTLGKPILKLVEEDYNEHGLYALLSARGSAYDVNIEVFKSLQGTITGWPGGKPRPARKAVAPEASAGARSGGPDLFAHASEVFPKRVVVFSPHPDDDAISMGGTLTRLCEQGHDVHVAYQTSGNIAVFDDEAVRFTDFMTEFCSAFNLFSAHQVRRIEGAVRSCVRAKQPGEVDAAELQKIKTLIRRSEARAAARYSGVRSEHIHFLDMPFYETGRVKKKPVTDDDIAIIINLLSKIRPHQIYAAGDLSDPHGTHRLCLYAVTTALERLLDQAAAASNAPGEPAAHRPKRDWVHDCEVWLYRGAWQEWGPDVIDMAVPLSPEEVERKRLAIFKHQSQKDKALFPGPSDDREFWQRAEDRNRRTAELYDKLGLPEYQAVEAFVRWRP